MDTTAMDNTTETTTTAEAASLAAIASLVQAGGVLIDSIKAGRHSPKAWANYTAARDAAWNASDALDGDTRYNHKKFAWLVSDSVVATVWGSGN